MLYGNVRISLYSSFAVQNRWFSICSAKQWFPVSYYPRLQSWSAHYSLSLQWFHKLPFSDRGYVAPPLSMLRSVAGGDDLRLWKLLWSGSIPRHAVLWQQAPYHGIPDAVSVTDGMLILHPVLLPVFRQLRISAFLFPGSSWNHIRGIHCSASAGHRTSLHRAGSSSIVRWL